MHGGSQYPTLLYIILIVRGDLGLVARLLYSTKGSDAGTPPGTVTCTMPAAQYRESVMVVIMLRLYTDLSQVTTAICTDKVSEGISGHPITPDTLRTFGCYLRTTGRRSLHFL